ncbi:Clr5 domain-containing protein [Chaetomium tenue]|uniref:Clr5 domain-containing protein n=1 Tax=Chaetomium tenue TaxID=1854479 RepID=A0ACB7PC04_9PEZI|nr:Clr5 domain-containing protein [Chaetomium globosum]
MEISNNSVTHYTALTWLNRSYSHRNMAVASRRSKYGSLNWGEHQPLLKQLYLDEDRTLRDVAKILKDEYRFAPSISAYKRQFATWGWRKNSSTQVAHPVGRSTRKRQSESGKDTGLGLGGAQFTSTGIEQVAALRSLKRAWTTPMTADRQPLLASFLRHQEPRLKRPF